MRNLVWIVTASLCALSACEVEPEDAALMDAEELEADLDAERMRPGRDGDAKECSDRECGPGPLAPSILCKDGTIAGPVCDRDEDGVCGWTITQCDD